MKKFKINRDSWHYKINTCQFNMFESEDYKKALTKDWEATHADFCSYWRATITKLIVAKGLTMFALLLLYILATNIVASLVLAVIIAFAVGIAWAIARADEYTTNKITKVKTNTQPSLLKQKYLAWKHNYCPLVEFENDGS